MAERLRSPATRAQAPAPAPARLVNLTEHELRLDARQRPPAGASEGGALTPPSTLHLPPAGLVARVDDHHAHLSDEWLGTAADLVQLTRLGRSRRLTGLPEPQQGTRYVVSRLTAHAARHRRDLVFPLAEVRDDHGRVTGARELGAYRPALAVAERYRDWRARAYERRRLSRPLPRDWITGVLLAASTALLSGAIALAPGVLDNASKNGWAGGGQFWTAWLTVVFLVIGAGALTLAARRWLIRQRMLAERGTAYVVEEEAIGWQPEEKDSVLAAIHDGFPSVLRVPGPGEFVENWRWQADADGAAQWDLRTDQLVHSFWAVHRNDDPATRNAVFVWAPWPVAMAFAARATARRRGLLLHVRQRPSGGAAGVRQELRLEDTGYDFLRFRNTPDLPEAAPSHALLQACAQVTIAIQPLSGRNANPLGRVRRGGRGSVGPQDRVSEIPDPTPGLVLLLVRFVTEGIGAIPADIKKAGEITLHVPGSLAGSVLPPSTYRIPAAEWRLTAADKSHVPWQAFPAAAEAIASWVEEQAAAHHAGVVLLAARMPQEIAVGLGIQLGQRSTTWPHRVYPVYYAGGPLVVPDLSLGREPAPAGRE
jgi:hypothetical protein